AREYHTATLLPNGKVLTAGGQINNFSSVTNSAELYDVGLGYSASSQPQINTLSSPLGSGSSLVLGGLRFRGLSEASAGNSQNSSTDFPLVQLRSIQSGRMIFLLS